ncbi:outer membrane protein TolC [Bradyrhizobium sp. GM5.1]
MHGVKLFTGAAVSVLLLALAAPTPALADTIEAALVRAYQNNPQLNAQRAQVRSTDENVPQALSGYRPKVGINLSTGYQYQDIQQTQKAVPIHSDPPLQPNSASLTINQTLYNGNQTANRTRVAESQVSGSREALRVLEQTVLLQAATSYMDYLRDSATLEVQRSNVRVLEQTLKQTRDRFNVGEVTRTDVAQSEAQLAAGRTQALTAESNLTTTRANFRRIIGNEPTNLAPGSPVDRFLPGTLASAVGLSLVENPNVTASMFLPPPPPLFLRHRRQLSPGQDQRRRAAADPHGSGWHHPVVPADPDGLPNDDRFRHRDRLGADLSGRR